MWFEAKVLLVAQKIKSNWWEQKLIYLDIIYDGQWARQRDIFTGFWVAELVCMNACGIKLLKLISNLMTFSPFTNFILAATMEKKSKCQIWSYIKAKLPKKVYVHTTQ